MDQKNPYLLPVAIIIAGAILAGAIYLVRTGGVIATPMGDTSLTRPVDDTDRVVGSPDAPVMIVEYSDIDCAYCKDFQAVLEQLMAEYGPGGQVAWTYRHFPVLSLHPNAALHAEAAECAGSLGGTNAFFRFIGALQQAAPDINQFSPSGYEGVVTSLGLSVADFNSCVQSDRFVGKVTSDFENAVDAGGTGTPYTVILIEGSEPLSITGAIPYAAMKEVIDQALTKVTTE